MSCFVLAVCVFVIILYIVYMLSLPDNYKTGLSSLYYFLAVFNWIVGAIVACMLFMYVRKLKELNEDYGKMVLIEAGVFIGSMAVSGGFCYYLGSDGINTLVTADRDGGRKAVYALVLMPVFCLTEFLPALAFAFTIKRWGKLRFDYHQE